MKKYEHTIELKDNFIIETHIVGDSDEAVADQYRKAFENILATKPKNTFNVLVNMEKAGTPDTQALRIYAEVMKNKQIHKIAIINAPALPKFFAEVVKKFAEKDLVQFFDTEGEAREWLLQ